jgi:serine/threonine protein kinase
MLAQLVVIAGPDQGRTISLAEGQTLTIGRGEAAAARLTDPHASRSHCRLEVDAGRFYLHDSGSSGGTFVNAQRITKHELKPGGVIRIGGTELRFQLEGTPAATPLATPGLSKPKPAPAVTPLEDLVGKKIAHFEIQKQLAIGSSGFVFRAQDGEHNRAVALKVLWPETSKDEEAVQRFVRAMKTMLPIRHANIVELYAAGKSGPYCWLAMEYVEGESLAQVIPRIGIAGMLEWQYAFRVAVHIGRALEAAFEHEIIHRNVTPANILVRSSDKVAKLGDLMLAKAMSGTLARQVTKPGELVGDLLYMSP